MIKKKSQSQKREKHNKTRTVAGEKYRYGNSRQGKRRGEEGLLGFFSLASVQLDQEIQF